MSDTLDFPEEVIRSINTRIQKQDRDRKVIGFAFDVMWKDRVANTHCCPQNGTRNFTGREKFINGTTKPTGYPGWLGRVWIRYNKKPTRGAFTAPSGFGRETKFYTGTGGYGSYDGPWRHVVSTAYQSKTTPPETFSWDCKIWADDWPELYDIHRMDLAEKVLTNSETPQQMLYEWTDPIVEKNDKEFTDAWIKHKKLTRKNT